MGNWIVEVEGNHITVRTPNEEISSVSGLVTYSNEQPWGERCCDERIPPDQLGRPGHAIVTRLRRVSPGTKISIGHDHFNLHLGSQDEVKAALTAIDALEAEHSRPSLASVAS